MNPSHFSQLFSNNQRVYKFFFKHSDNFIACLNVFLSNRFPDTCNLFDWSIVRSSVRWIIGVSVSLFVCWSMGVSVRLFICWSVGVCLFVCLFVGVLEYLFVCLFVKVTCGSVLWKLLLAEVLVLHGRDEPLQEGRLQ